MLYEIGRLQSQDDVKKLNAMIEDGIEKDLNRFPWIDRYIGFSKISYPKDVDTIFIARFFEDIVGAIEYDLDKELTVIQQVYVHPHHRRAKIGTNLMKAVEESARAIGGERMFVQAGPYTKNFYNIYGFEPQGLLDGENLVKMLR